MTNELDKKDEKIEGEEDIEILDEGDEGEGDGDEGEGDGGEGEGDGEGDKGSDKKPKESLEDRRARLKRELKQTEKKLGLDSEEKPKGNKSKTNELDRADKAFLVASGIKGSEEFALVQQIMKDTGKDLDSIIESRHFQADLKDLRDKRAASDALPKGPNRTKNSTADSVEYWIQKGELPPNTPENRELRQKVVNARLKKSTDNKQFTDTAVA